MQRGNNTRKKTTTKRSSKSVGNKSSISYADSVRNKGVFFLGTIVAGATPGDVCLSKELRPSDFPSTRWGRQCELWERYTMKNARVKYSPSIPDVINCNLITYHETDIEDADPVGAEGLNIALAHRNAVQHPANAPCYIKCVTNGDKLWTSKGSCNRQDALGKIVTVMRQSPVNFSGESLPSGTPLGDVTLEWDCLFETANLEPRPSASTPVWAAKLVSEENVLTTMVDLSKEEVLMVSKLTPINQTTQAEVQFEGNWIATLYGDGFDAFEVQPLYGPAVGELVLNNASSCEFFVFGAEVIGNK